MWRCQLQTRTMEWLSSWRRPFWQQFSGSEICFIVMQKECATPPHIHPIFRFVTACDQFYQACPTLILQVTNTWVKRPGYIQDKYCTRNNIPWRYFWNYKRLPTVSQLHPCLSYLPTLVIQHWVPCCYNILRLLYFCKFSKCFQHHKWKILIINCLD